MTATKTCTRCGTRQPLAAFPPAGRMRDGRSSWCRGCAAEGNRRWRASHPEYVDAANAARRVSHPPRPCHGCGIEFIPKRIDSRHCCEDCRLDERANGGPYTPEGAALHWQSHGVAPSAPGGGRSPLTQPDPGHRSPGLAVPASHRLWEVP